MKKVNVAIECDNKHKASIHALITSLIINKNTRSEYCIFIQTNINDLENWQEFMEYSCMNIDIKICTESLINVGRVIFLKWNTLVTGDLTEFYNIDLEDKSWAAVENLPDCVSVIPERAMDYNDAVLLIDTDKWNKNEDYKKLSIYYNYGYDEFVKNQNKIVDKKYKKSKKDYVTLNEWALVIRTNRENSPEVYFDIPSSDIWMKYYMQSRMRDIVLERKASAETIGNIIDKQNAIPVLIPVEDSTVVYTVVLIESILEHLNTERQLDIRLVYTQLSRTHKDLLASLISDRVSIILYNVQEYFQNYQPAVYELLIPRVFPQYNKVLFFKNEIICQKDISELYDMEMEGYGVAALEPEFNENQELSETIYFSDRLCRDTDLMLVNVTEWNFRDVNSRIEKMLQTAAYKKYPLGDIISIVCQKFLTSISHTYVCRKKDGDADVYRELLDKYIAKSQWSELLRQELDFNENREDENVKEVLDKIQKLEENNQKLTEKNKQLKSENERLSKERNQFLYEILEIRKSVTYKIGRILTFIPRKIRGSK